MVTVVAEKRRIIIGLLLSVVALAGVAVAYAGDPGTGVVTGVVHVSARGTAKADGSGVVLYLVGFEEPPVAAVPELQQKDKNFQPPVLAITAGQSVSFPNQDAYFHNVFSLSPTRSFDLGQYQKGETRIRPFLKTGVVEVYCNIHPQMAATILVLPNRRFARTDAAGHFRIEGVPPGQWSLFAYDRLAMQPVKAQVTVAAGGKAEVDLRIDETRDLTHTHKFGQAYGSGGYR
jgi:plastocyanin